VADATNPRPLVRPIVNGIPTFIAGHPVSAGALTRLTQLASGQIPGVAAPRLIPRGEKDAIDPAIRAMTVVGEESDFILCAEDVTAQAAAGGVNAANTVRVAKPYLLRKTPWHGKVRAGKTLTWTAVNTRTALDSLGLSEEQVIVPAYEIGDVLLVTRGLARDVEITPDAQDPTTTEWQDLNTDGRGWATA